MKNTTPRIISLTIVSMVLLLLSCESLLNIEVGILWRDDTTFSQSGSTHLCILKGKWDSETGFDDDVLETSDVVAGTNDLYKFSLSTSQADHFTAFIFVDNNGNGKYDEGYDGVLGYKYNYGESGGNLEISLSAYY